WRQRSRAGSLYGKLWILSGVRRVALHAKLTANNGEPLPNTATEPCRTNTRAAMAQRTRIGIVHQHQRLISPSLKIASSIKKTHSLNSGSGIFPLTYPTGKLSDAD
ncbi:hypothetical protein J5224_27945, partial [Candidatus Symbiopectobacterium sp. NZEC135]|nr:hypothetical protein [Candidatus Symbiopectobacterium sp. NZEC135]